MTLGSLPIGTRVRIGINVGVVREHRGAVVELEMSEPDFVDRAWFAPTCDVDEVLEHA